MFGSGFSLGFGVTDLQAGIAAFIGLAPVAAIVVGILVLAFVPKIIRTVKGVVGRR